MEHMVKLACPLRLMGTKQLHHNHHQRKKKCIDLLSNFLNRFFKDMYDNQSREFVHRSSVLPKF